jgi:hypothetical protein
MAARPPEFGEQTDEVLDQEHYRTICSISGRFKANRQ